jgi:hypothetical protein
MAVIFWKKIGFVGVKDDFNTGIEKIEIYELK